MMILGLDIGTKRTGVAIANAQMVVEHTTLLAAGDELIYRILELCGAEAIERIVVGLPQNSDGSDSAQTTYVRDVVALLEQKTDLPIMLEDEFLTTSEAYRQMELQGVSREQAEQRVDQYSAKLILEQYLASHREHGNDGEHGDGDHAVL